ncbi:MAG: hypothetical protein P1U52_00470 [Porticoccaceae bacterium]|nr:hypothetical protein [Porticoccaceae bacterium]
MNSAINTAAAEYRAIRCVDDNIYLKPGDVCFQYLLMLFIMMKGEALFQAEILVH